MTQEKKAVFVLAQVLKKYLPALNCNIFKFFCRQMTEPIPTLPSISFLYKLSLATGKTLDFTQNCANFFNVLISHKDIASASLWLTNTFLENEEQENEEQENEIKVVFSNNMEKITYPRITTNHTIWQRILKDRIFSVVSSEDNFLEYVQEDITSGIGAVAIYALEDIGFLKIYSPEQSNPFSETALYELSEVIEKFTTSTKACFIHSKLQTAKALQEVEVNKRKKLLEELEFTNQELKEFAYIVSHDLKAPLRAIRSLASWIEEDYADVLDEIGLEQLKLLQSRAVRMHHFIEGILEYSRIGRLKEKWVEVDLSESIDNIIDMLNPAEYIAINIPQPLPKVFGEKVRIEQVFLNLLSNAIKYNDKENPIIEIRWTERGSRYHFEIEDNGQGIQEKHYKTIFQLFQTLQSRDTVESTGIGLTIVKKIIELHNGVISVQSEYGVKTIMSFSLPKVK
jgi:signal transduction histidine kinase